MGTILWAIDENQGTNLQAFYSSSAVWKHKKQKLLCKKKNSVSGRALCTVIGRDAREFGQDAREFGQGARQKGQGAAPSEICLAETLDVSAMQKYGAIRYVKILRDRESGNSKGLAYVKYGRAYDAAIALETCPDSESTMLLAACFLGGCSTLSMFMKAYRGWGRGWRPLRLFSKIDI